jgi:peptidoglycan hydrolase CwlO-like protein
MTQKQNILKDMLWNNWRKMISIEVAGEFLTKNPTDDYWKQNRKQKVSELADSMQELADFIQSLDAEVEDTSNAELDAYMLSLPKYTQSKEGFIQDAKMFFEAENR